MYKQKQNKAKNFKNWIKNTAFKLCNIHRMCNVRAHEEPTQISKTAISAKTNNSF